MCYRASFQNTSLSQNSFPFFFSSQSAQFNWFATNYFHPTWLFFPRVFTYLLLISVQVTRRPPSPVTHVRSWKPRTREVTLLSEGTNCPRFHPGFLVRARPLPHLVTTIRTPGAPWEGPVQWAQRDLPAYGSARLLLGR